jgi:hypothetical protein
MVSRGFSRLRSYFKARDIFCMPQTPKKLYISVLSRPVSPMDSLSDFTAQTATPHNASLLNRLGMPETPYTNSASSSTNARSAPRKSSSILERMQLSGNYMLSKDNLSALNPRSELSSCATGCTPTVQSTMCEIPARRRRLSQAAAASSGSASGTDLKLPLLSRLDSPESPNEAEDTLRIKGSAATSHSSREIPSTLPFPSGSRYRRGRGHKSLMDRMHMNERKERV